MKKMLFPVFSIFSLGWLFNLMNGRKYFDYIPNNSFSSDLSLLEESGSYKEVAYDDGLGRYTIGIGTTIYYYSNGKQFRKVRYGDTLTNVKSQMGFSSMSSRDFAYFLVNNFIKYSYHGKQIYSFFKVLDSYNLPFDSDLANALLDFKFHSGSMLKKTSSRYSFVKRFLAIASLHTYIHKGQHPVYFSIAYAHWRFSYIKSLSAWSNPQIKLGWTNRVLYYSDIIRKKRKPYSFYYNMSMAQKVKYAKDNFSVYL